jgi:hypothetical protein
MKIRIVKAGQPTYWYADKIGEVLNVTGVDEGDYVVEYDGTLDDHYVDKTDCEEVIEYNSQLYRKVGRPVCEGDTVLIVAAHGTLGMYKNGDVVQCDGVSKRGGYIYSKQVISLQGNSNGVIENHEFVVIELIDQPTPAPHLPSYAEVSELLHEARADNDVELFRHEGVDYRKVKREAQVGELVVGIENDEYIEFIDGYIIGNVYKVVKKRAEDDGTVQCYVDDKFQSGAQLYLYECEYEVLEPLEQPKPQSDRDLIANLAKELAEVKRELSDYKSTVAHRGQTIEAYAKSLERRVSALEGGDVVEVIEKAIAELKKREGVSDNLCDHYEKSGIKDLAQFHNGKAHAFLEAQQLLAEAKRNV